jgi:hypothetical protein
LNNGNVTEQQLIDSCCERIKILCKDKHVLVLNDTTEINLRRHLGRLQPNWSRELDKGTKESRGYKNLPIEVKESYKWIKFCKDNKKNLKDVASLTVVGDRESDIYELFIDAKNQNY